MALKLPDSAVPMGDFPVAKAVDIDFDDGENLQEKLDNGSLGSGGTGGAGGIYTNTPIGTVLSFAGLTPPNGYLLCDGCSYVVADYQDLYDVIGNTYGGDAENFNVPNLIDKFIQGSNTSGTEKQAGLPNITGRAGHFASNSIWAQINNGGAFKGYDTDGTKCNDVTLLGEAGSACFFDFDASLSNSIYGNSNTVQPPALTMAYIIKAFHTNEGVDSSVELEDNVVNHINNRINGIVSEQVTNINDKLSKLEDKRVYNSLEELNTAKGLSISFTNGEDNTMKIVDALSPVETFSDFFSNSINNNRFGIDTNTHGTDISLLTITKFNDDTTIIRAFMVNGKLLIRRYFNGVLEDWQYNKEVSDLFQSVSDGKTLVANAITGKGVSTSTTATFATMATNIGKINGCKEETKSKTFSTTGVSVLTITFSANVLAVKQIIAPSDSCSIVPQSSKNIFTINGKELVLYVTASGTWEVTALIQN